MEVRVEDAVCIPEGSILSIRAGASRRQGAINVGRAVRFTEGVLDANPFTVDLFAPLASSRLTLMPTRERYTVNFGPDGGEAAGMKLDISVKAVKELISENANNNLGGVQPEAPRTGSRQKRRGQKLDECQEYVEKHQLIRVMQNLMQSVLAVRPEDPFAYMERNLRSAKADATIPASMPPASPKVPAANEVTKRPMAPVPKDFNGAAFTIQGPLGDISAPRPLDSADVLPEGSTLRSLVVPRLIDADFNFRSVETPLRGMTSQFRNSNTWVTQTIQPTGCAGKYYRMLLAGPREKLHFKPSEVVATIVTCGGLCPGLNAVVRQVVQMLHAYGVKRIFGIRGGYKGVTDTDNWLELTPQVVQDIHDLGGTILASDRGNPPVEEQAAALKARGVRQHFVIGGDGTHRGAQSTYSEMRKLGWECAVVGIPKTIDNDVPMLDRTFGFDTACTEAAQAVRAAYVEATCNANCIGLVKLMGRHCGFIAMHACLAARFVDICLLPEMEISAEKVLNHCLHLHQTKGHAVIVVAEGCGNTMIKGTGETDAGGNVKLADVGLWLRDKIVERFKQVKLPLTVKYIDPTYMIRAVKPNANDSVYCAVLAENAVHAAMAGYTGVTIGKVCERYCMLPMQAITGQPPRRVDLSGRWFFRLLASTRQPDFSPDGYSGALPCSQNTADMLKECSEATTLADTLKPGDELRRLELEHLGSQDVPTTLEESVQGAKLDFFDQDSWVTQCLGQLKSKECLVSLQMLRAGPRKMLHFKPGDVAAAIVTCGGLCPGLNSVIRELVNMLYAYGMKKVYGIKGGFKGAIQPHSWITLTPDNVKDIHLQGGTVLVSDRGNPPEGEVAKVLRSKGVRQYFVLGGDGTHRGAYKTSEAMRKEGWDCAVVGVPKTIDNDIALLDRTFGFETACSEALKAIASAYVEARCNANCIGMVKLMGRHCGYLAMMSVLAARYVDICLLPEMDISLEKVLEHSVKLVKSQGYAVVVVGEGCGDTLIKGSGEVDAGGNKRLADVGLWLKEETLSHFKSQKLPLTIKYIDPTYMVRSICANASDSVYCSVLAQAAVHGAMAGYTGITVAQVDESFVYLPIRAITESPNRKVDVEGKWFERMLATTMQPHLGTVGVTSAKPAHPVTRPSRTFILKAGRSDLDELRVEDTKLTVIDGYGCQGESRSLARSDIISQNAQLRTLRCFNLQERFGGGGLPSTLTSKKTFQDSYSWVTEAMCTQSDADGYGSNIYQMMRAGPREKLHFDPHDPASCAAIISCGGICPGLNSVIRELVNKLWDYGVRRIFGIRGGYKGVMEPESWLQLTPEVVQDIHTQGGTMLVSDRGNPPIAEMARVLKEQNVKQYFVLGGDGTHKGAMQTFESCLEIDHECAVVGVPKTIDNDVPMLDQTFGFDTACSEAVRAVDSAYVEATCNANCIGLVKLMGRHCGFIALGAALAARHADICLLPEMDIDAEKVLKHTEHLMRTQRHAVIVVAEGCGDTLIKSSGEVDAGGNKLLADAGLWLKGAITDRFKQLGLPLTIKYIDPTYMIRSVPANAFDSQYCAALAQNAVHGAMAGYSGITVGKVHERYVYLPIHAITMQRGRRVDPEGAWFMRMLETTKQPNFIPDASSIRGSSMGTTIDLDVLSNLSDTCSINEVLVQGDVIKRLDLVNLAKTFKSADLPNPTRGGDDRAYINNKAWATTTLMRKNKFDDCGRVYYQMLLGGPRQHIHFDPAQSSAVIVTCGGLCPGLNSVIREIVMTLRSYGVSKIHGCRGGYKGMVEPESWMQLTPEVVRNIHMQGGTMLVSDRGNPPLEDIAATLQRTGVRQCFVIGGDGTHRGAMGMFKCTEKIGHECAVVGIPKTIDNDIPILDRSFGFKTACTEAVKAIDSAYVEATSNSNCLGIVKLMGRHCGWIAMEAVLAARHVDVCLLPEMDISLPKLLTHIMSLMTKNGSAVIVVAEGCGDTLIQSTGECDAGGNKKLADVGPWLSGQCVDYFKKMQVPLTVKFIDPTYTIRAVPANANDSVLCSVLAQHAVHGAMAGFSGITVGKVDEHYVMLPIHAITEMVGPRKVDLKGRQFERLLETTGQPSLVPGPGDDWALLPPAPPPMERPRTAQPPEVGLFAWRRKEDGGDVLYLEDSVEGVPLKIFDGFGEPTEERMMQRGDLMNESSDLRRLDVMRLSDKFGEKNFPTPLPKSGPGFMDNQSWMVEAMSNNDRLDHAAQGQAFYQLLRAGPRQLLQFDPADPHSCAAIVTCGGLCPGENAAIREIVLSLRRYGVKRIFGIRHGFLGIVERATWVELTPEVVQDIHQRGGTVLKNSRGNPPAQDAARALKQENVRQFFAFGGDGTHRGVLQILTALAELNHECACLAVPSTINNDIPLCARTFGFDTACTVARDSINAAYVEATCNANCIGLVKMAGDSAGFLAMEAVISSRHVDVFLIPEMEISLAKVLEHCEHLMSTKKYAVVVVAEGCKESLFRTSGRQQDDVDIGTWLREQIMAHFKAKGKPLTIKYIDPTYTVRSAKPNAHDRVYCSTLAEHVVHGAMAGITGASVVRVYERHAYMPIQVIAQLPRKRVNPKGRWCARALFTTRQPHFEPDGFEYSKDGDFGETLRNLSSPIRLSQVIQTGSTISRLGCPNLGGAFQRRNKDNPLQSTVLNAQGVAIFVQEGTWSTQTLAHYGPDEGGRRNFFQFLRCGPRELLHFDPQEPGASAAIVTCGGLCPGLNSVIRELASMLHAYGVQKVYGIRGGYNGCTKEEEWMDLSPAVVQDIHMQGGSILVSDRGNPPVAEVAAAMQRQKVRQFFVLGGDGTHKGALEIFKAMTNIGHECAVVGVPKTIDNDIQVIDRSFGFDTACTEAMKAIDSAYVEATTNANCIGLVKLMGRHCGWIAATATLAARHVDVCLIPEMNISLPKLLNYVGELMRKQRRAVIVVAEGCGDTIIQGNGETDAGGNKKLADVGPYLKDEITKHCKTCGIPVTIKYIDPTYMVRSVPANAFDSKYCATLAQEAVHAAMGGYTGITVGRVDDRYVMLPIHAITEHGPRRIDLHGRVFERLQATTLQPCFEP